MINELIDWLFISTNKIVDHMINHSLDHLINHYTLFFRD